MNLRDLVTLAAIGAAIYYGKLELDKGGDTPTPDAKPAAVVAVAGTPANFATACHALADNIEADGKAMRPVILYSIDAIEAVGKYFDRPFAANLKTQNAAALAEVQKQVAAAAGEPRTEINTASRAAIVAALRAVK